MKKNDPGYLLPDIVNPDERICICVPVPKDWGHIRAFLGQLVELGYWYTWQKDDTHAGKDAAAVWREIFDCVNEEINKTMSCGCGCDDVTRVITRRLNPVTGAPEISLDDGVTWQSDPESIYNKATEMQPLPILDTNTARCEAANNVIQNFKDLQIKYSGYLGTIESVEDFALAIIADIVGVLLLGIIGAALIPLITLLIPKMFSVIRATITMTSAEYDALFTSGVWDTALCIIYCRTPDDLEYTESDWLGIINALKGSLGSGSDTAGASLAAMVDTWGVIGLKNASRIGSGGEGNCDDCTCADDWWYEFDFRTSAFNVYFAPFAANNGHYVAGEGWKVSVPLDIGTINVGSTFAALDGLDLIGYIVENNIDGTTQYNRKMFFNATFDNYDGTTANVIDNHERWIGETGGFLHITSLYSNWVGPSAGHGADVCLVRLVLHGKGNNPFGADNYVYDAMSP